jgi:hypothetical protein
MPAVINTFAEEHVPDAEYRGPGKRTGVDAHEPFHHEKHRI